MEKDEISKEEGYDFFWMLSSWRVMRYIFRAGPKDRNSKFDWERKRREREREDKEKKRKSGRERKWKKKNRKRREKKKRRERKTSCDTAGELIPYPSKDLQGYKNILLQNT